LFHHAPRPYAGCFTCLLRGPCSARPPHCVYVYVCVCVCAPPVLLTRRPAPTRTRPFQPRNPCFQTPPPLTPHPLPSAVRAPSPVRPPSANRGPVVGGPAPVRPPRRFPAGAGSRAARPPTGAPPVGPTAPGASPPRAPAPPAVGCPGAPSGLSGRPAAADAGWRRLRPRRGPGRSGP
jgi:hypothetical protein